MNKNSSKKQAILTISVIIAIIIVVNIISTRVFTRVDLSKNKSYTLSPISKDIVKGLEDKLVIKGYFSDGLPPPYNNLKRDIQDLLNDYRSYSKGNLNYEFYNPTGGSEIEGQNNELQKEAEKYGIQPVQIQVSDNNKMEVKKIYVGLVFLYAGKQEIIPVVQSTNNLEYEITSMIKKMTTEKKKKIGFLTGNDETDYKKMNRISQILSAQYDLQVVDVSLNKAVPDDISALIVFCPKSEFKESQLFMLDQYIMRGGRIAWLINKIAPNFQQQIVLGEVTKLGLDDFLANYGIRISNDLVRDLQCSSVQVQSQIGIPISMKYPYFPMITNINRTNPAFNNIESVTLTFASTIDTSVAAGKNVKIKPLLLSSDKSGLAKDFFILNLEQFQSMDKKAIDTLFNLKSLMVGAIFEGSFKSYFAGKTPPADTATGSAPFTVVPFNESQKESRMIAIGDGDFANEENRPPADNITFFVNMVDYLVDDVGLAEIRSKEASEAPLKETSDSSKMLVVWLNRILPPALILLFGLYKLSQRRIRKKNLQAK
ncbi:MAG: Gldg family protein [Ignavibacteria bacterium]|nr:Gldg family protein [Ignavibacteria bacterium]